MQLFTRIVATGSLSAAGREFGLSPGAVSQRLKTLEGHYGCPLLTRSSRALALTEEGRLFLQTAQSVLSETETLDAALARRSRGLTGRLRVAAPADFGRQVVEPLLIDFRREHPDLQIEFHVRDDLDDVIGHDFDVVFRYGNLRDSSLVARSFARNRRVVVGAPDYFATHGTPERPEDLSEHRCLALVRGIERRDRWHFVIDGQEVAQEVHAHLATNDGSILRHWTIAGYGVAMKSLLDVKNDLEDGRLVEVLADHTPASVGAQLLFPAARRQTPRVRAFVDAAVARCEALFGDSTGDVPPRCARPSGT